MRIVVVGAYGLIGSYVVARLLADGHAVMGVGRSIAAARRRVPDAHWAQADLATTSVAAWAELLRGADAVVNCAGALQDSPRDDLRAVHVQGVARLIEAGAVAGVARFVHVSAAGVQAGRDTAFNCTKLAAETLVRGSALAWVILRPGLVLAPAAYGGTALLRGIAALPFAAPSLFPDSRVQVVGIDDVTAAVARAVAADAPARVSVDLVHAERLSLAQVVTALRRWLGMPPVPTFPLPASLAMAAARLSDALAYLGWRSPMRTTTLLQLRDGITGDAAETRRWLGRDPQSLRAMLTSWPSGVQERWFAKTYFLKPLMLATLFGFWLLSGIIGLTGGMADAVAVLTVAGVAPPLATGAVVGGSMADIALAFAVAFRRTAPRALQGMLLVAALYLVAGTLLRPDLWGDPLGPFLKTIPAALLAACALAIMDER